jgi:hypothetical protein
VYEHAQSGESFTIPDPSLRLDQLSEVQQQVADLLSPATGHAKAEATPAPASDTPVS